MIDKIKYTMTEIKKQKLGIKHFIFLIGFLMLALVLFISMFNMRTFGNPVNVEMDNHFIEKGQQETGANNIVTSVVFDYRGFDTLGEASVLFATVLSIGVLFDWSRHKISNKSK